LDPLGYLYDFLLKHKSVLIFEFIFEAKPNTTFSLHIEKSVPTFCEQLRLEQHEIVDPDLKCYSDLGPSVDLFLPALNSFMEAHPKVLRLAVLNDTNQFDLRRESRRVVRLEFLFDANSEGFAFGEEIVELAVKLADAFATVALPHDVLDPIQQWRLAILKEGKKTD
jgi:hypothetical protein